MAKTILYKLLGIGKIPEKLRPELESEGIIVSDEGIGGWYVTRNFKSSQRRCLYRKEGFSGCLIVTRKRLVAYSFGKRQIHIAVNDPKIAELFISLPKAKTLSISFEAGKFHADWQGIVEFLFKTEKALEFSNVLKKIGVSEGHCKDSADK